MRGAALLDRMRKMLPELIERPPLAIMPRCQIGQRQPDTERAVDRLPVCFLCCVLQCAQRNLGQLSIIDSHSCMMEQ